MGRFIDMKKSHGRRSSQSKKCHVIAKLEGGLIGLVEARAIWEFDDGLREVCSWEELVDAKKGKRVKRGSGNASQRAKRVWVGEGDGEWGKEEEVKEEEVKEEEVASDEVSESWKGWSEEGAVKDYMVRYGVVEEVAKKVVAREATRKAMGKKRVGR